MSTESFEKNNVVWQIQQLQQRVGEWWELRTSQFTNNLNLPSASWDWINFSLLWETTKVILISLLVLLIIGAAWQIWQLLSPFLYHLGEQSNDRDRNKQEKELSITDWLRRSQQYQQQGDYYKAFQCLYLAVLQRLNDRGIAPHQASRTDGEYLQIIQQLPHPQAYQFLLMTHQRLCFGSGQASLSLLEECQQAYRDLEAS
ncbi:hypothetical protein Ple7327_1211 [Pleurocapsa sp. PCC 7327]|uniref:DUF4129 domain-containing protein n=1 Tax=Pleurocapsa sp. PCC 7327 TaxID=118163 RepID=UPI00029FC023|nr:DUF4129 domain-containing protein [Pleurocapsa sp. PCC 7327]AFY76612.1 hypothetical protein Ple7327_1211 [Pleurocapsa sp. PCC 7327]